MNATTLESGMFFRSMESKRLIPLVGCKLAVNFIVDPDHIFTGRLKTFDNYKNFTLINVEDHLYKDSYPERVFRGDQVLYMKHICRLRY
ncbi:hypothetical protein TNCT_408621 [Trichonephila clavata]|uniref:LSM domain-containing protein n=1 Tax=Trichonephila clavata TaxID=2740835 RepID=A0A8X6FKU2_TRICU|nr:hypothetical protein TNCT_408621 [Trichonephila clavata]